jgi:glycosyltransferase involved in cell wall biosynthesis
MQEGQTLLKRASNKYNARTKGDVKMEPNPPILKDTTLLMMVRDELINPAGGIYPMLSMQAPLCEQAIVVDTGSKDGTRQILEQMATDIPNLAVYDIPFDGFGLTRNKAGKLPKTKWIMFLDADELITEDNAHELALFSEKNPFLAGIDIPIYNIIPGWGETLSGGWNPRLYQKQLAKRFDNLVYEVLTVEGCTEEAEHAKLLHFKPVGSEGERNKKRWYRNISYHLDSNSSPSEDRDFLSWKLPDPKLLEEYGIPYKESLVRLEQLGLSSVRA